MGLEGAAVVDVAEPHHSHPNFQVVPGCQIEVFQRQLRLCHLEQALGFGRPLELVQAIAEVTQGRADPSYSQCQ